MGEGAGRSGREGLLLKVAATARAPAASAQGLAVAAAAGVGPGLDAQALGSSPPGTFSHEMLHFLGSTVKRKSKGRKRSPAKEAGIVFVPRRRSKRMTCSRKRTSSKTRSLHN